jgi:type I restriction enzyme S subunit
MTVNLHNIAMQNAIVDVLSSIDKKIQCNNKINDNLQHQLKLLYDYWFTQFDFPDDNGKPYRASGGAMVWNEQLKREIPLYWSIGTVSDCVEKISTGLNPRDNFVLGNGSIRYITVKNLTTTGSLDFSGCDMIDEEARAIVHRRSDISVGDILFASIAPLGRCYLIQQEPTDWDINESVFSIRSKTDKITPEYLYLFFQSDSFIQKATNTSTGSIFKGIRINTLLDTKMIIPELQVCRSFTSAIKPLLAEINNNSAETARLTALRDWLLPMLMNGQATISD